MSSEPNDSDLDLTPRTGPSDGGAGVGGPRRRRNPMALALVVLVVVGLGFVLIQGLGNAVTYYYNADEALAKKAEIGDRRFRVQGWVQDDVEESSLAGATVVRFSIAFKGKEVEVVHTGDPERLFEPGIPVVLEGRWDGDHFASDKMLIKHSSEYKAENPDRVSHQDP